MASNLDFDISNRTTTFQNISVPLYTHFSFVKLHYSTFHPEGCEEGSLFTKDPKRTCKKTQTVKPGCRPQPLKLPYISRVSSWALLAASSSARSHPAFPAFHHMLFLLAKSLLALLALTSNTASCPRPEPVYSRTCLGTLQSTVS